MPSWHPGRCGWLTPCLACALVQLLEVVLRRAFCTLTPGTACGPLPPRAGQASHPTFPVARQVLFAPGLPFESSLGLARPCRSVATVGPEPPSPPQSQVPRGLP